MKIARGRLGALVAVAAVAGLAVAGCGGDDDGGGEQQTAEEFRTAADMICEDYTERLDDLGDPDPDNFGSFLNDGAEIQEEMIDELKGLDPPDELSADFDGAIASLTGLSTALKGAAEEIEGGAGAIQVFGELTPELEKLGEEADDYAEKLGLETCGS